MRFGDHRGSYEIENLPGNSQVAVSTHSFIFPNLRGLGLGKEVHKERLKKLQELGYNYVLCTVDHKNVREINILNSNGWMELTTFTSSVTGHTVRIYGRAIANDASGDKVKDEEIL